MNNFKFVYKILSTLEAYMDYPAVDPNSISHETLGISKERWSKYIEMMLDVGYIKGVEIQIFINGETVIDISDMKITLKGLEYLQENSIMQKLYKAAKGIKEITPMI